MIRFKLFGVPAHIHFSFWVTGVVWGFALTACEPHPVCVLFFVMAYLVSLLAHALGHALCGRRMLGHSLEMCLSWVGSNVCSEEDIECSRSSRVLMLLAGPLGGVVLAGIIYLGAVCVTQSVGEGAELAWRMLRGEAPMEYSSACPPLLLLFVTYTLQITVWWSVLNLLPIYPLDGGTIMHELMECTHVAHSISLVATCVLTMVFFALGLWALAVLMLALAYYNYRCILVHTE